MTAHYLSPAINLLSDRVIYFSKNGVVADGVTDQTTILQAMLNEALNGPIRLVNDLSGIVYVDHLLAYSNTKIDTLNGGGWKKKGNGFGVAGTGLQFFRNVNVTPTGTNPVDQNIHIRGGYFDCNRRGGGSGGSTAHWTDRAAHYGDPSLITLGPAIANDLDQVMPMIGFYGVEDWSAKDIRFFDMISYGLHASNSWDGHVEDIRGHLNTGDTHFGSNVVQTEGGMQRMLVDGVSGTVNDDLVACNANDGQDIYPVSSPVTFIPGIVSGPCSDLTYRRITLEGTNASATCLRFLSGNTTISRVLVDDVNNLASTNQGCIIGVYFNDFGVSGGAQFNDFIFKNFKGITPSQGFVGFASSHGTVNRVLVDGITSYGPSIGGNNGGGVIQALSGTGMTVGELIVNNVVCSGMPYILSVLGSSFTDVMRGTYSASGLTADVYDPGSRITTIRRA